MTLQVYYIYLVLIEVQAVLRSPPFPQVQFLRRYMRFHTYPILRTYNSRRSTCGFALTSFPAGTVPTNVYAFLHSSPFTHVQFPQEYMRFCTHLLPRTYSSRRSTCDFFFTSFSTGTGIRYSLLRLVTRINIKKGCLCSSPKKRFQAI